MSPISKACADLRGWMDKQSLGAEARQACDMVVAGLADCAKRKRWHPAVLGFIAENVEKLKQAAGACRSNASRNHG